MLNGLAQSNGRFRRSFCCWDGVQKCSSSSTIRNRRSPCAVCRANGARRRSTWKARAAAGIASIAQHIRYVGTCIVDIRYCCSRRLRFQRLWKMVGKNRLLCSLGRLLETDGWELIILLFCVCWICMEMRAGSSESWRIYCYAFYVRKIHLDWFTYVPICIHMYTIHILILLCNRVRDLQIGFQHPATC